MPRRRPPAAEGSPPVAGPSSQTTFSWPTPSATLTNPIIPSASTSHKRSNSISNSSSSNLSQEQVANLRRQSNLSTLSLSPRRSSGAFSGSTATVNGGHHAGAEDWRRGRRPSSALGRESVTGADESSFMGAAEAEGEEGEGEGEEEEGWGMVDRMRNWRNDAMTQHLYSTANFWGSKIFGITGNPNDAFWLAQIHFFTHQFAQAERILTAVRPCAPPRPPCRLTDTSLACRYLAAQCQVRLGKWDEALDMVGRGGLLGSIDDRGADGDEGDGGVKLQASTSHLRGLIHLHLGATELAKDAFVEALSRDVKCFESFEMLVGSEMLSNEEEWEFIQGLQYAAQTGEDADFVRMLYTVRLRKIKHRDEMTIARQRLTVDYGLGDDPDVLFGLADELYAAMRFAECFRVTSKILSAHSAHRPTLPLHLSCMHHLPSLRSRLYLFAQELVDNQPDDAVSWYAVGMWYFSGRRWEESRRYFGKSVLIDSRFAPSWIAFAHSYAYEGEHDQAITAYSTALRHFQGTHLPLLFIGMQHLGLANVDLALEYLEAARTGCKDDPLVWNELGVVAHMNAKYEVAIEYFEKSLELARQVQSARTAWSTTHLNLGHAYRKLGRLSDAHASFRKVLDLDPRSGPAYSALGLVEHLLGQYQESIARYHEALSITPGDPVTCELLKLVLEDVSHSISSENFPFPGLPPTILANIDEQVAKLDAEILTGAPVRDAPLVQAGSATNFSRRDQGMEVEGDGGETYEEEGEGSMSYAADGEETMDIEG